MSPLIKNWCHLSFEIFGGGGGGQRTILKSLAESSIAEEGKKQLFSMPLEKLVLEIPLT